MTLPTQKEKNHIHSPSYLGQSSSAEAVARARIQACKLYRYEDAQVNPNSCISYFMFYLFPGIRS